MRWQKQKFQLVKLTLVTGRLSLAAIFLALIVSEVAAYDLADEGNGVITDQTTGLNWQKQEGGKHTWENAILYCENLVLGEQDDWRLPTIYELKSIVDNTRYNPAISQTHFPDALPSVYWSSSTPAGHEDYAWFVSFNNGQVNLYNKSYSYYVRCVRTNL